MVFNCDLTKNPTCGFAVQNYTVAVPEKKHFQLNSCTMVIAKSRTVCIAFTLGILCSEGSQYPLGVGGLVSTWPNDYGGGPKRAVSCWRGRTADGTEVLEFSQTAHSFAQRVKEYLFLNTIQLYCLERCNAE